MKRLLVLTHSAGFKHDYLPLAVETLEELGEENGLEVFASEDCSAINKNDLKKFSAILFITSGELPMSNEQKRSLINFVKNGGGFIGVHNAADTFHQFQDYGEMLGGYFKAHPWTQEVVVKVEDNTHPATRHLPEKFRVKEEVYTFKNWSRNKTHVLISLDNSSIDLSKGTREDHDYALSWCHDYGRGRVFYTAFGHFPETWCEEWFRKHLAGGIAWAMGIL
ncbi:MAG: ThuA domain-containing protein [Candidatus Brockarchaeota archaeon]|nr:ThuA domain-containing protein [Candidatus Brockarchaeota archaeon]